MDCSSIHRREVLRGAGILVGSLLLPPFRARAAFELPEGTRTLLEESALVYISPIRSDGRESKCHGEVWFTFDQGDVLICTSRTTWKAKALEAGRDRARIWVGDFGRGDDVGDRYKGGASFLSNVSEAKDRPAFDRLLDTFGKKYPQEWGKWEPRFREGYEDGSRVVIRYTPVGA
jgi:hypothetical protein